MDLRCNRCGSQPSRIKFSFCFAVQATVNNVDEICQILSTTGLPACYDQVKLFQMSKISIQAASAASLQLLAVYIDLALQILSLKHKDVLCCCMKLCIKKRHDWPKFRIRKSITNKVKDYSNCWTYGTMCSRVTVRRYVADSMQQVFPVVPHLVLSSLQHYSDTCRRSDGVCWEGITTQGS